MQAKWGVMVPGVPRVVPGNWGWAWGSYNNVNAVFCEESLGKTRRICRSFSEWVGPRIILLESLQDKQSSCSISRDNKGAIYEFKLRKHRQKKVMMLRRTSRMLKNQRIVVSRTLLGTATTVWTPCFAKKVWERLRRIFRSFSERVGLRIILLESLQDKQSSCSISRDNKGAIYEFKLRKHRLKKSWCWDEHLGCWKVKESS